MMGFKLKVFVVISSGVVLSVCTYAAYRIWKKRLNSADDEGFEDVSKLEETLEKKVLVLGLEGSGKSTLVSQIVKEVGQKCVAFNSIYKPTEGFNVTSLSDGTSPTINIWEIGGKESVRRYWAKFFQDTDILVFVVDASNNSNLSIVVSEIKSLLGDARLASVPILVLANKQDVVGALGAEQISNVLDLKSIPSRSHQVKVLETQTKSGSNEIHPTVCEVRKVLLKLSSHI
ncbi:Small GTPase superfamily, ARF type,Small GTP-binding protein domain,Small GTPase superfamily, ARF/SAR [Cinara cedri]|uniref:Small GTPase superfamily, ARF type,Small GTP-binding protein domain,Small GTPase superfamily, ARF/SAR n=1 Tax=Cinara cedri TaxID=506608 RepID=A0A5E4MT26_9HEMI|nr:Small GTPase superfamily, ARF type,Small GTP-binding protein domain,Small GTPase superfamily, ARF/SAR [Cinara cedri]